MAVALRVPQRNVPKHLPPRLQVVDEASRRRIVRFRRTAIAFALMTILALLATVAFHVELAQKQFELEGVERATEVEQARYTDLRLRLAEAQAPERIIAAAQKFGLVAPSEVTYLTASTQAGEQDLSTDDSWEEVKPYLVNYP